MIHVFSECNIIQKIWNKLGEWLPPELNLQALTPQNAILGILAKDAHLDLLLPNFVQTRNISMQKHKHFTRLLSELRKKSDLIQKVEYKIAQDSDCLFSHLSNLGKILYKL